jgi:hypothetical protein
MTLDMEKFQNSIEHLLLMYAKDYVLLPADKIYDQSIISELSPTIQNCHIYFIGEVPKIHINKVYSKHNTMFIDISITDLANNEILEVPIPKGFTFKEDEEHGAYAEDKDGNRTTLSEDTINTLIYQALGPSPFNVLYIGQAYGKDGERHAIDRLIKHSTLQKIALEGVKEGYKLQILLLGLENGNTLNTFINPRAKDQSDTTANERISNGLDTLYGTSKAERVSLFEAAMIRYFKPKYNTQLKDSFPSTNLKLLQNCYEKDLQSVVAEITFETLPYHLYSESVAAEYRHVAHFDLHKEEDRRSFFALVKDEQQQ